MLNFSLPAASEGWGKVMFSLVSVCLSTPPARQATYAAGGMPPAVSQEGFLVSNFVSARKPNRKNKKRKRHFISYVKTQLSKFLGKNIGDENKISQGRMCHSKT